MQACAVRKTCRACGKSNLVTILDFGKTPPANSFLRSGDLDKQEDFFPLKVVFCRTCGMVQLKHVVNPQLLFGNYMYVSSTSPVFRHHFQDLADQMSKRLQLKHNALVVDIGSNDGILLKPFKKLGTRILGIEPAKNIARRANKDGVPTKAEFFSTKLAKKIASHYGQADLITATNVFAHIDNLDEVILGVKTLLADKGVFLLEVAYLGDLLSDNLFDSVYHEHLCYWAISPLVTFFQRQGMEVFDVIHVPTHGGSIRILAQKLPGKQRVSPRLAGWIKQERQQQLNYLVTYRKFAQRIEKNKKRLTKMLRQLKHNGSQVAGYGAPAKSTTLLHYFKIGKNVLNYIVDDSLYKQGLLTPGTHIPVVKPEIIYQDSPDYVLILAWNFADSIIKNQAEYIRRGGKFIIPVPYPMIHDA